MKSKIKVSLGLVAAVCLCAFGGVKAVTPASANESTFATTINTSVYEINNENLDNGNCLVMTLTETDYMTATEWNNYNYKWLNDEDLTKTDGYRLGIDYANNNLCNAPLDQNLSAYNFEEYIFINGQSLAEFSETNAYTLIANKRTRVDTISLDFAPGVMDSVTMIEIKAGCQLPTLSYSYTGNSEASCLLVEQDAAFKKVDGRWSDFLGYETGKEYDADQKMFDLTLDGQYKGHSTTALDGYTDFFYGLDVVGEFYYGKALASAGNTQQGNVMVLRFVNPIDVASFPEINLRVYTNYARTLYVYNAEDVTEDSLGTALQVFNVKGGGCYSYLDLTSAFYAGDDGKVQEIIFEFGDDGAPSSEQFFFISFHLSNEEKPLVDTQSFTIIDSGEGYDVRFRFNKIGASTAGALDTSKVLINGVSIAEAMAECADITAEWIALKGICQIGIYLPKTYTGAAQIKNAQWNYAGNSIGVVKGLTFPDGTTLDKTYACHLYAGETIVDCEMVTQFKTTKVEKVSASFVEDSQNLHFVLYFDKNVTSSPYYHACETEFWRSTELKSVNENSYDADMSKIFVDAGYKSSLLDSISLNGKTIGEWHAHDSTMTTNVMIHYGNTALNCVDIFFESHCPNTYDELSALVKSGNGITIEVNSGLKFMVNTRTEEKQTFTLTGGSFTEEIAKQPVEVYFNGVLVEDGDVLSVTAPTTEKSIAVKGNTEYTITSKKEGDVTVYTISYGEGQTLSFSVKESITQTPVTSVEEESDGCSSNAAAFPVALTVCALAAIIIWTEKRRKSHEE